MSRLAASALTVRRHGRTLLDAVSFTAEAGERIAVIGPNGAGKSTLLRALAGLIASEGQVRLDGAPLPPAGPVRARAIAYLPQEAAFHWPMLAQDVVALGRIPHGWRGGPLSNKDAAAVTRALGEAAAGDFTGRAVDRLSGGERARVALARALAVQAPAMFADEPVAALDARYQTMAMAALAARADEGALVIAVLHDLTLAARWASRVLAIASGRLVADGPPRTVLTESLLADLYGARFDIVERPDGLGVLPASQRM